MMSQMLMEMEVQQQTGAAKHERTLERKTQRNSHRERIWETRVGEVPLRIPKLRVGSYFPSLLEPRKRAKQALLALVAVALRTIFAQPDQEAARRQLQAVYETMVTRWPKAAKVLLDAENDVLAYMMFPQEHWKRIYSNNILERLNKEVKRRTNVVGVFPNEPSVIRLTGVILQEPSDEWQIAKRCFSLESMRKLYEPQSLMTTEVVPFTLAPVD